MKTKSIIIFLFLLGVSTLVNAQAIYFTSPSDNHVISIPEGQSTTTITIAFGFATVVSPLYKLFADPSGNWDKTDSQQIPRQHTLGAGQYNWRLELYSYIPGSGYVLMGSDEITFYVRPTITVRNSFGAGIVIVNNQDVNSGYQLTPDPNSNTSVSAIDQDYSSYNRLFDNWSGAVSSTSRSESITAPTSSSVTATANFVKEFNIDFVNSIGSTYVNSQFYSSSIPTSNVRQYNSITASGNWTLANGIEYSFSNWTKNGQFFSTTFTPTDHGTYTAVYIGKPTNSGKYASASAGIGDPIEVTWTDNPNTAVNQFEIWRKVKHNGVTGSPVLLATVGRGVQSYTDYEYVGTDGYTNDLLWYDVRAYYSTEGTYSDPDYQAVYGRLEVSKVGEEQVASIANELPSEYSISNFPNPFNPTTKISYQMPESGFVTVKVYDMLGKEIATLVNGIKNAGYHNVTFDAGRLTSGIYIYTINAGKFSKSRKMLLMK